LRIIHSMANRLFQYRPALPRRAGLTVPGGLTQGADFQ
jgi:hypothetical protein